MNKKSSFAAFFKIFTSFFIFFFVFFVSVNAAKLTRINDNGILEFSYSNDSSLPPPIEEPTSDQATYLKNSGFNVTENNGLIQLEDSINTLWANQKETNYSLRGLDSNGNPTGVKPILSFMVYKGSLCEITDELIVILDFSQFYINTFSELFLNGLCYAIFGNNTHSQEFSYTVSNVPEYDSKSETIVSYKSVEFNGGSFTIDGVSKNSYSLRIVLPNLKDTTIKFEDYSLWCAMWEQSIGKYPDNIALDISSLDFIANPNCLDFSSKSMDDYGDVTTVTHFHFIAYTSAQLEYAFDDSTIYISSNDLPENYVTEIFVKNESTAFFTKIYAKIRKNVDDAANLDFVVIDKGSDDILAMEDKIAIMRTFWYVETTFPDLNYYIYHQIRNSDGYIEDEVALVIANLNEEVIMNDGNIAFLVKCNHISDGNEGNIGYFSLSNKYYDLNKEIII